jgi:hypothetical protein
MLPEFEEIEWEIIASGGGIHNKAIMKVSRPALLS